jgi:GNAT superfamily N-acetyltransferase
MTQRPSRTIVERIAAKPESATFPLATPERAILSPLSQADEPALASFLDHLSDRSRRFYSVADSSTEARERCLGIAAYDKLRLVLRAEGVILALSEFSFDLLPSDIDRFARHQMVLHPGRDCRWGLCVTDAWQRRGIGTAIAAASFDLARSLGNQRAILWGGVHTGNHSAISYYREIGFAEVGRFVNDRGIESIDMFRAL